MHNYLKILILISPKKMPRNLLWSTIHTIIFCGKFSFAVKIRFYYILYNGKILPISYFIMINANKYIFKLDKISMLFFSFNERYSWHA